jgi:hypothetical protein
VRRRQHLAHLAANLCGFEKEKAAPTYQHGYGYHPLLAWLDNTGEALAGMLRPGNANANAAADHVQIGDEALAQIPDEHRHGTPILIRADGAGATKAWLAHLRSLSEERGLDVSFSVGFALTNQLKDAIGLLPETAWTVAVDAAGEPRPVDESGLPVAQVAELTGLLPGLSAAGWPEGMRVLIRRERPHPGAQISVFEAHDGWRYQAFATDTPHGQLGFLEARHRAHARVEDRIRTTKQLALTAADLIAWTQTILLTGELAKAEPKLLRYRLLHTAARIIRRGRRTFVKIAAGWPWADNLAAAFTRLAGIRQPLLA